MELRPYQIDGLAAIWNYFQSGNKGNPVVAWPTGTGKTVIPAVFIEHVIKTWPNQRFLIVTHVKELIEQNYSLMKEIWPNSPAGIYSSGLKRKEIALPIIFGGIQSMIKNPAQFGHRDIAFVDEAHLVNLEEDSMYQTFFKTMKLINPNIKIIGMSATPYRMGQGYIVDGGLFTDIVHDITGMKAFNDLISDGYLAPLIPRRTKTEIDVSNVGIAKGEFIASQLQFVSDKQEITFNALKEIVDYGTNRRSWLIFASGIEHSDHIAEMLQTFGIQCASVHSKQKPEYNDAAIKAFKNFELRSIVSFSKLTTGFNHPGIDLIGDLRPTLSVPLHVQKYGRATRPFEGKENAIVLDFARNTPRLGPINDPIIPRKKGEKAGDAPIKLCEECGAYNHASVRFCCACGAEFAFKVKIVGKAGTEELIKSDAPIIETYNVDYVVYAREPNKDGKPPYIRVTYFCGMQAFKENVFPEHQSSYSKKLFSNWWKQRHQSETPKTTHEALQLVQHLRKPKAIRVHVNLKYPQILNAEY